MTIRNLTTAAVLFTVVALANGQQSDAFQQRQGSNYKLQVNSRIVLLDVVVTDSKGHTVSNLTKDDFQVFEDKVPQELRSFEVQQSNHGSPLAIHSTIELDKQAPNAPVSIIVLDELNTSFTDEGFTRYSLKKYLNTHSDELVQPTMLIAVNLHHFLLLRDYTTSKKEILSALDHHLAENPWRSEGGNFQEERFNAALVSLMELAQATAGHPGRKNVIWIGRGFPSVDPSEMLPDNAASLKEAIETCTNMLRDSRITLYTIDPSGISAMPLSQSNDSSIDGDPFGGEINFNSMAESTGGKAFFGRNDVDNLIGTSVDAGTNFYTLSYSPLDGSEGVKPFRNILVRVKDPRLRATTRKGYYLTGVIAPNTESTDAKADVNTKAVNRMLFDLAVASDGMMVYDTVPFTVEHPLIAPDDFVIHLRPQDIAWESTNAQTLHASIALLAESFDKKGNVLKRVVKNLTLQLPSTSADVSPQAKGVDVHISMPTCPPTVRLRFVVRMNQTGKLGAQNFTLISSAFDKQ